MRFEFFTGRLSSARGEIGVVVARISIKINEAEVARVSGFVISQTVTNSLRWLASRP